MSDLSREHQYVPRCVLKRFAGSSGYLYGYRKHEGDFIRRSPRKLFVQTDLHNQISETGILDDAIERQISKFESKAAPILKRLVQAARLNVAPALTQQDYEVWTAFFLFQWKRAPEFQDRVQSSGEYRVMMDETLRQYERDVRPLSESEKKTFSQADTLERFRHNLRAQQMLRLSNDALAVIRRRGVALVRMTSVGESLLIGSNPVMKLTPDRTTELGDHEVEVWLPAAPDVLIGLGSVENSVQFAEVSDLGVVQSLNDDLFAQCSIVAGRSKGSVASVVARSSKALPH